MSKPIKNIPIKRVAIKSEEQWMQIPDRSMMGMTPNGNNFIGTTPGGTRVVYDRVYLWQQKNSPLLGWEKV